MENKLRKKTAMRVSILGIIVNVALAIFKLLAGIIGSSSAMVSDAVHTISDIFSTVVVMIGVQASSKESDKEHQYGHERIESISAFIVAVILCITGFGIGYTGIEKIITTEPSNFEVPTILPLIAAVASIALKEMMFWLTNIAAKKISSQSLKADAWHHRSDAFSSIGSFVGILGARLGFPILDPIFSVLIALLIIKSGIDIIKDTVDGLIDKSLDEDTALKMKEQILNEEGVASLDVFKTRLFGSKAYVDIEISADKNLSLEQSHEIAQKIHDDIEKNFLMVKHIMVHVNPCDIDEESGV